MKSSSISVVVPVYKCEECLSKLSSELIQTLSIITEDIEIIFINDASPDGSWSTIKSLSNSDGRIKGINLSKNFGQHAAITAGLDFAEGDWVVVMDCDLQDEPKEIIKLYNKAQEGYDVVFGRRVERKDGFYKKLSSRVFYKILDYFTDKKSDSSIANFSIISKRVVDNIRELREQNRFYPFFVNWVGFNSATVDVEHARREAGRSSYTFSKLIELATNTVVAQSNKPLKLSIKFGFLMAFVSLLYSLWLVFRYFFYSVPVEGWTSVMVSIYFISGLMFVNIGFVGLYIGKIFDETKKRPLYIIQETSNLNKND